MLVKEISSERHLTETLYHLHIDKNIIVDDCGFVFRYDKKDWLVHEKWIISKSNGIVVVSNFERLNINRRRVFIIDDLLSD